MPNTSKHAIQSERRDLRIVSIAATPTGSTNDTVLNFGAAATTTGPYALSTWVTATLDAVNGASFKILRRGKYLCTLVVRSATVAGTTVQSVAISMDTANLTGDPAAADAAMGVISTKTLLTGQQETHAISCVFHVGDSLAGGAATGVIRFHGSNGAGATIAAAGLTLAECFATIRYIGDASGQG